MTIPVLSAQDFQGKLLLNEKLCLLDVRLSWEYELCSLTNSLHIPLQELKDRLVEIPRDRPIVILCHHGVRSQQAAKLLIQANFQNVFSLEGGIDAWAKQIDPSVGLY
jgi:rhodanese-related sulfurtransferase